ncbi:hypothetical protein CYMTET_7535 [Cymbomonas tetramitiformis]|uniref:Uncharacterized protein n=1 Tax=Cymbomonas tetramitiformis TaxID=36881 RepID=A0AAE0GVH2_9CHLO|nr:hypothetical protein CYMTET_7535 [Cymbomonas tetramitiformis]
MEVENDRPQGQAWDKEGTLEEIKKRSADIRDQFAVWESSGFDKIEIGSCLYTEFIKAVKDDLGEGVEVNVTVYFGDLALRNRVLLITTIFKSELTVEHLKNCGEQLLDFDQYSRVLKAARKVFKDIATGDHDTRSEHSLLADSLQRLMDSASKEPEQEEQPEPVIERPPAEDRTTDEEPAGMQDYEEGDEFDLAAFDEAEEFEQLNTELQENDDYDTDDEDGGLRNDDFLASVKVERLGALTTGPFTEREISEVSRLLKTVLLQAQKTIAIFSVEGKKYPNSATPFLHVKVASIEEARVLVEYAVVVVDSQDFLITPKSSKLTSITLGFKASRNRALLDEEQTGTLLRHFQGKEHVATSTFTDGAHLPSLPDDFNHSLHTFIDKYCRQHEDKTALEARAEFYSAAFPDKRLDYTQCSQG